ncbi:MAG: hypothetical protein JNN15_04805 [Blastocatellia bacterium]|nr:hypothetical protein [Blastocatellia bacterium]
MEKYPKYVELLKGMNLDLLCSFEDTFLLKEGPIDLTHLKCEKDIPKEEVIRLLRLTIKDKLEKTHITLDQFAKMLSMTGTEKERRTLYLHLGRCPECAAKVSKEYIPLFADIFKGTGDSSFQDSSGSSGRSK